MPREMKETGIEWIGEVPKDWELIKGKYILRLLNRSILETDDVITCFRDGEVTLRSNRREDGFTLADKEIGYQGIEVGDLVVHGMDGFAGAIGISDSRGKASPVLNVLDSNQDKKYIMYYLRTMAIGNVFTGLASGIRVRSVDLRWSKLSNLYYPVPPINEQKKIADLLDKKCQEIEDIKETIEAEIKTLDEYKKSMITEAVTKGLDKDAETKDSGIEWIGQIPKHWKVSSLKYVASLHNGDRGQNYPSGYDLVDEGIYFLTSNNIHDYILDVDINKSKFITEEKYKILSGVKLKLDDIIFCLRGSVGNCSINKSLTQGTVASSLMVIRPIKVNANFLNYVLQSNLKESEVFNYTNGSCAANLSAENVLKFNITIPPLEEQKTIAEYLDHKTSAINEAIEGKRAQLVALDEYKKSLIYEYVTGKKEA